MQLIPSPLYPEGQRPQEKEPTVLLQRTPGKHGREEHSSMSSLQVRPEKNRRSKELINEMILFE